jgi:hypothetical protein
MIVTKNYVGQKIEDIANRYFNNKVKKIMLILKIIEMKIQNAKNDSKRLKQL